MRQKRVSNRSWYIHQCNICQQLKHILKFRRRSIRYGRRAVCKLCEGELEERIPTGLSSS